MHLLLKWRSLILALVAGAAFVPLTPAAATLLEVEGSGAVPGFQSSEQLRRYLTLHMAEAHPVGWRFEPAAAGDAPAPDRVKWRFKLGPYAGGEVRTFVPPYAETFGVHRPITIEARLYLNGEYQTAIKENAVIQSSPDDPDLATAVASLTQNLLSPSEAYRSINSGQTKASHRRSTSRASARFAIHDRRFLQPTEPL
jgi:hypothetical protein